MQEYKETRYSFLYKNTADMAFYSAGKEHCTPSWRYGPRIRPYHLIHFVLEGKGKLKINDKSYKCKKGDIFIIPADSASVYQADEKDPWTYCWISFLGIHSTTYINQILGELKENYIIRKQDTDKYKKLIDEILEISNNSTSSYFLANGKLFELISMLFDDVNFDDSRWKESTIADQLKFYLEMNYFMDLKISEVAREFNVHPNYLTRTFKNRFNTTPKRFLNDLKYQKAQGLLTSTSLPISEIASSVGITDQFLFAKEFKKRFNVSPSNYRKNF